MSSIPNKKMKHAHVNHDAPTHEKVAGKTKGGNKVEGHSLTDKAKELAEEVTDAVKSHPKTIAGIGAAVLAGAAALVAPAIGKAIHSDGGQADKQKSGKK